MLVYGKCECFIHNYVCVHPAAVLNAALVNAARGHHVEWVPNKTAYKRWNCHCDHKQLCKWCRNLPPLHWGPDLPFLDNPIMRISFDQLT